MRDKLFYQLWVLDVIKKSSFRKVLNKYDLYCGQDEILRFIRKHPGCKQIDLANFYKCTPASIATSTKRLEKAGFLEKRESPESLREKALYLTKKGEEALFSIHDNVVVMDKKTLENISEEEKQQLENILGKMIFNLSGKDASEIDINSYIQELQEDKGHGQK